MVARAIAITTATSTTEHEPVNDTSKFEMAMRTSLLEARRAAAAYLVSVGRSDDARVVSNGGGDDFLEVRVALQAIGQRWNRSAALSGHWLAMRIKPSGTAISQKHRSRSMMVATSPAPRSMAKSCTRFIETDACPVTNFHAHALCMDFVRR